MRLFTSALCTTVAVGLLAGCSSGNLSSPTSTIPAARGAQSQVITPTTVVRSIPDWIQPTPWQRVAARLFVPNHTKKKSHYIYASEFAGTSVLGYENPNQNNSPPFCSVAGSDVNGFGTDTTGNLVVPQGYPRDIYVYKGPGACGSLAGSFPDNYGQPATFASNGSALTGSFIIGNITTGSSATGSISICSLAAGCTSNLTSSNITGYGGGVAIAKNGDCWISSENSSFTGSALTYFKGCSGSGQNATGWKNSSYGGLNFDRKGNLVTVDFEGGGTGELWVYRGCAPDCKLLAGPLALHNESFFGDFDASGHYLVLGDYGCGCVDIYWYILTTPQIRFDYSFTNGLSQGDDVESAAYSPSF